MPKSRALHPDIKYPIKGLEDVLQRKHSVRHGYAGYQLYTQALVKMSAAGERGDLLKKAALLIADQVDWLQKADDLKQRGLYVDPQGGSTCVVQKSCRTRFRVLC